jgi:hypothetical protein
MTRQVVVTHTQVTVGLHMHDFDDGIDAANEVLVRLGMRALRTHVAVYCSVTSRLLEKG